MKTLLNSLIKYLLFSFLNLDKCHQHSDLNILNYKKYYYNKKLKIPIIKNKSHNIN